MSVVHDPLDAYTADEIDRAAGGESIAARREAAGVRLELCLVHLEYHAQGGVECREASRRDGAEASTVGPVRGIRSRHSHWRRPPWQV
jgi:hypothetical protein